MPRQYTTKQLLPLLFFLSSLLVLPAQSVAQGGGEVHGNVQMDAQYYRTDSVIGAFQPEDQMRMNAFANVLYTNGNFTAGMRYEAYLNALLGFLPGYTGTGIPYKFVQFRNEQLDITAGSFYEQFGSGMIFRTYEERLLGVDNAMDGFRVKFTPRQGILLRAVYGKQRFFFDKGPGIVRGIDGEINLNEALDSTFLGKAKTRIILGGSFVSKYQDPTSTQYILPANVGAWAARLNVIHKGFNFYTEYAYKINDPSKDNGYIYKPGQGFLAQATYGQKGLGIMAAVKYIDNMSFRSDRNENLTNLQINYLPALTRPHTYNLAATLYPYATQPNGEFGAQIETSYKFKRVGPDGKKKDIMQVTLNASFAQSIDTTRLNDEATSRLGYTSPFFSLGDSLFFTDVNLEIKKKWNKQFTSIFTVMYLYYDLALIQGHIGAEPVQSNIFVADLNYKINSKHNIRMELQYLYMHPSEDSAANAQRDRGDWATALVEYTVSPHWFVAGLLQYNLGNADAELRTTYPYFTFGYIKDAHRISIGFGRQRAGLFCVGGVCRPVPASNGMTISITSSF
jgi:hypothetical protein